MNLREVLEHKRSLELCMNVYGFSEDVKKHYQVFISTLSQRYASVLAEGSTLPDCVLDAPVSETVRESFRPLYDIFRTYSKEYLSKELPELK